MYIHRQIESRLREAADLFPAIVVTGARQSGKSTLLRQTFPSLTYVNLDDPQLQLFARQDPRLFLSSFARPMILDEIQYAPQLLHYIKTAIDDDRRKNGQYLFIGSQMLPLMSGLTESLAGRLAVFHLYPFHIGELEPQLSVDWYDDAVLLDALLKGFYPEFFVQPNMQRSLWFSSYLATYVERDIRSIKNVSDLGRFHLFIQLLAARAGALLNLVELAKECGITSPTAKSWLSLLESTYIVHLLYPFHRNLSKRLVKTPKLYFLDTGLLCHVLGIDTAERLLRAGERGRIFENFIVAECVKRLASGQEKSRLWFYRTANGLEVDLVFEYAENCDAVEIKFSKTPVYRMASALTRFQQEAPVRNALVFNLHRDNLPISPQSNAVHWLHGLQRLFEAPLD